MIVVVGLHLQALFRVMSKLAVRQLFIPIFLVTDSV